ncbi:hypothetical protein IGI04_033863 [Brassica rapa subsp. trilocularis]|uniref:Serine-threonine/tyrosine-protein kinase catalytic domain-containing protein n=1 Tax=Brassica rapa subsp. trilocularis TaxID=1813537 RepID=A0ABQ7LAC8_BRACM|nr:hypothetical protein IGI04_033863 [Brassica rapa subsp. trilocularis]
MKHSRAAQRGSNDRPKPVTEASQAPKGAQTFDLSRLGNAFTYEQLLKATEEFNDANLIKRGHSGSLFRAGHKRLVPFLGHCLENENQKVLVYKYMRNGDLASALFRKSNNECDGLKSWDWITRLKIALVAAEALRD